MAHALDAHMSHGGVRRVQQDVLLLGDEHRGDAQHQRRPPLHPRVADRDSGRMIRRLVPVRREHACPHALCPGIVLR